MNLPSSRPPGRRVSAFALLLLGATALLIAMPSARADVVTATGAGQPVVQPENPLAQDLAHLTRALNIVWVLIAGFLVMFMQAGFALVETGLSRAKNVAHTMSMNFLVYSLAMIGFFATGFAFMFGGVSFRPNGSPDPLVGGPSSLGGLPSLDRMLYVTIGGKAWGLLGLKGFFLSGQASSAEVLALFLYMMVFMDTTATIPTGALAERWRFKSFTLFSLCVGAFMYSVYGCWMWGGGWLAALGVNAHLGHGAVDYAGSSVVHLQGGVLAYVTCKILGPRLGKYDHAGNPRPLFGHHMPMVMVGTFILAFGWFGFNAGSSLSGSTDRIALIAVNTMLASGAAAAAACFYMWQVYGKPDPSIMCTGMLGGLVAITAPCAFVSPFIAFLIGAIAGLLVVLAVLYLERTGTDDPVGAISIHGVGGLWGILAVGLFANGTYGDGYNRVAGPVTGLFYGDHSAKQFLAQLVAAVTCVAWNLLIGGAVFTLIGRVIGSNRVAPEIELAGLDIPEMGAPGYPEFITHVSYQNISSEEVDAAQAGSA